MTRSTRSTGWALLLAALLAVPLLGGCTQAGSTASPGAAQPQGPAFPVTVTDDASRTVTIAKQPQRIVSLAPANTEILYALGLGDKVVGVTTYDDYPAEVKSKPKVGDFVQPNVEAIAATKPDLILATTGVQGDVLKKLEALGAPVVAVDPQSLDAVFADIERIGQATGATTQSDKLVAEMKGKVATIEQAVSAKPPVTAFVEIGQNPLYSAGEGTILGDLVKRAGGTNVVTQPGYVAYSLEQLVKADPQVYLATRGSMSDPAQLEKRAGYDKLSAVTAGKVFVLDDNLTTRPGPRIVLGLEQVARALHPDALPAN